MNLLSKFKVILFLIALSLFCNEGAFARSQWRFLIYMQADNNLYDYAIWDLLEMQSVENSGNVEIFIRMDSPGDNGLVDLKVNFSELALVNSLEQVKELTLADLQLDQLRSFPELAFGSQSESLEDFIFRYGEIYSQTALFIWGHGEGFSSDRNAQFGGVAIDDYPQQRLAINELQQALELYEDLYADKLSLLAMDACLMQTLETSIEIQEEVEYFIGSTQIQNFKGLPYHKILKELNNSEKDINAYELSKLIPNLFIQTANEEDNVSATMSSVNTHEMMNVFLYEFNKTFKIVNKYIEDNPFEKIPIKELIGKSPFFLGNSRDLATSLRLLEEYFHTKDKSIAGALSSSNAALSRSIVNYQYGEDYFQENSEYYRGFFKAFAIWFPASSLEYQSKINDFKASKVYQSEKISNWFQFLDTLHKQSFIGF